MINLEDAFHHDKRHPSKEGPLKLRRHTSKEERARVHGNNGEEEGTAESPSHRYRIRGRGHGRLENGPFGNHGKRWEDVVRKRQFGYSGPKEF